MHKKEILQDQEKKEEIPKLKKMRSVLLVLAAITGIGFFLFLGISLLLFFILGNIYLFFIISALSFICLLVVGISITAWIWLTGMINTKLGISVEGNYVRTRETTFQRIRRLR